MKKIADNSKASYAFPKAARGMLFSAMVLFSAATINSLAENPPASAPSDYKADWPGSKARCSCRRKSKVIINQHELEISRSLGMHD
jgi:hypothetical protein